MLLRREVASGIAGGLAGRQPVTGTHDWKDIYVIEKLRRVAREVAST
jgi:hypothetical protein